MMLNSSDEEGDVSPKSFQTNSTITSPLHSINNFGSSFSSGMDGKTIGSSTYGGSLSSIASSVSAFKSEQSLNAIFDKDSPNVNNGNNLKLYILVARCIAFPFAGKRDVDVGKKNTEMISFEQFNLLKEKFQAFINGKLRITTDETLNTIITMFLNTMVNDAGITRRIKNGGWSSSDFSFIFNKQIDKYLNDNHHIQPHFKDKIKEEWLDKFDAIGRGVIKQWGENSPIYQNNSMETSKEFLFNLFQSILSIKKSDHRLVANTLQLDNVDEQTAQVRRELEQKAKYNFDNMLNKINCISEMNTSIDRLRSCLESVPLYKSNTEKLSLPNIVITKDLEYTKEDLKLKFSIRVVVKELKGLKFLPPSRLIYCLLHLHGCDKLSTSKTEINNPSWETEAEFETTFAFPAIKIKLFSESTNLLSLDDRCLAKLSLRPTLYENQQTVTLPMKISSRIPDKDISIKLTVSYDKPSHLKIFGYLWIKGKNQWKSWEKRYSILLQISQCTFLLCTYQENKSSPNEVLSLRGFSTDYKDMSKDPISGLESEKKFFFALTGNDEEIIFASDFEDQASAWVKALYRATGQTYKPILIDDVLENNDRIKFPSLDIPVIDNLSPSDYQNFYNDLLELILHYNLSSSNISSQGWLSIGQQLVIDEFCTRYSISNLARVLKHLSFLMNFHGDNEDYDYVCIDPSLIFQLYAIASAYVHGNRINNITMNFESECRLFFNLTFDLQRYAEIACINFRLYFPYGRPEGNFKTIISLLERTKREIIFFEKNIENKEDILSKLKEVVGPVPTKIMVEFMKKIIEATALNTYLLKSTVDVSDTRIGSVEEGVSFLLQQTDYCLSCILHLIEYHSDAFASVPGTEQHFIETIWKLLLEDFDQVLKVHQMSQQHWPLVQVYLSIRGFINQLKRKYEFKEFIYSLSTLIQPMLQHYIECTASIIEDSVINSICKERWLYVESSSASCNDLLSHISTLNVFVEKLDWPADHFYDIKNVANLVYFDAIKIYIDGLSHEFLKISKKCKTPIDLLMEERVYVMLESMLQLMGSKNQVQNSKIDEYIAEQYQILMDYFITRLLVELLSLLDILKRFFGNLFLATITFSKTSCTEKLELCLDLINLCFINVPRHFNNSNRSRQFLMNIYKKHLSLVVEWLKQNVDNQSLHLQQQTVLSSLINGCYIRYTNENFSANQLETDDYRYICLQIEKFQD